MSQTAVISTNAEGKRVKKRYMFRGVELTGHPADASDHQVQMFHAKTYPELLNAKTVLHTNGVKESATARIETYDLVVDVPYKAVGAGISGVSGMSSGTEKEAVVEFKQATKAKG